MQHRISARTGGDSYRFKRVRRREATAHTRATDSRGFFMPVDRESQLARWVIVGDDGYVPNKEGDMNTADMADEIARLRKERDELLVERVAMACSAKAWCEMAMALANKYPVDSQTFDYADELRETDWFKVVESRDWLMKAEALEEAADMARDEVWQQEFASLGQLQRDLASKAAKYRKQAEGES